MRRQAVWVLITGVIVVLVVCAALMPRRNAPFVLVGPVEVGYGIRGLLDKNTTRPEAIRRLGKPLRPRQAPTKDSSDGKPDHFGGVYCDVYWMGGRTHGTAKCGMVNFDFDKFKSDYGSDLRVLILDGSVQAVVSANTDRAYARRVLEKQFMQSGRHVWFNGNSLYVMESKTKTPLCVLDFSHDDNHLQSVFVAFYDR